MKDRKPFHLLDSACGTKCVDLLTFFFVIVIVVVVVGSPYPKDMLLADDHTAVMSELERRQKAQGNKKTGSVAWKDQHSTLAEQYGVQWPLSVPESLDAAPWFRVLPDREREASNQSGNHY